MRARVIREIPPVATMCVLAITAPGAAVDAQPYPDAVGSGAGSIACFVAAEDFGLEADKAVDLCVGAGSVAPASCYQEAVDQLTLSDLQSVRLCGAATSIEPARCAVRLADAGFEDREIVRYCAALDWPLVPAPTAGSRACVSAGLERTHLTEGAVIRLCRGSTSAAPVDCFVAGEDETFLTDNEIIRLCAKVVVAAPTAYGPVPGYSY